MNWGQLKAAFVTYLHRSDTAANLAVVLPIAEQRIYYGESDTVDALRIQAMLKSASLTVGTQPTDYLQAKRVSQLVYGTEIPLDLRPLDKLPQECRAFAWQGQTMVLSPDRSFSPVPVTLLYYARFDALDTSNDASTNWLLTNLPSLYLNALGVEIGKVNRDDVLTARYAGDYQASLAAAMLADKRAQYSGSPLTSQVRR